MKPTLFYWILLLILSAIWGSAFTFNKIALDSFTPIQIVAARLLTGAIVMWAFMRFQGMRLPRSLTHWKYLAAMAVIGNALPFYLITWGQQSINAGLAAIFMGAMPLVIIILAHFFIVEEPLNRFKSAGFLIGFIGLVVLLAPEALSGSQETSGTLVAEIAVFVGAISYGVNVIVARKQPPIHPYVTAAGTLLCSTAITLPIVLIWEWPPAEGPSVQSVIAVLFQGVASTAIAAGLYFKIIAGAGAGFVSLISYLIPVLALITSAVFLNESLPFSSIAALALILGGILLNRIGQETYRTK